MIYDIIGGRGPAWSHLPARARIPASPRSGCSTRPAAARRAGSSPRDRPWTASRSPRPCGGKGGSLQTSSLFCALEISGTNWDQLLEAYSGAGRGGICRASAVNPPLLRWGSVPKHQVRGRRAVSAAGPKGRGLLIPKLALILTSTTTGVCEEDPPPETRTRVRAWSANPLTVRATRMQQGRDNGRGGQNRFAGADSDWEAFGRNPTGGSFAVLAFRPS